MNTLLCKNEAAETRRLTVTPRYRTRETEQAYVLIAEVPGAERSSVETTIDGDRLTIVARQAWTAPEGWTPLHRESAGADYRLVLDLDHRVNREAVTAELNSGVLTLTIPKAEAAKPRKIEIA
jgi:HSP20 family molecular chaperone IbpA